MWSDLLAQFSRSWLGTLILIYGLGITTQYFILAGLAFIEARRQRRQERLADRLSLFEGDLAPPISILLPAYNEEPTIVEGLRSLMQLRYPSLEIVVVNDGSQDGTLRALIEAFGLKPSVRTLRARVPRDRVLSVYSSPDYPFLVVLDTVNGGKAMALNIALAFARHPLFCAIDADSVLERDTLLHLALPFYADSTVIVVGGVVRPANGCVIQRGQVLKAGLGRSHLSRFQVVEYLRGMLAGRLGWNLLDSLFIVSGALGLFSREAVLAVGGYRTDTLGEDMELVMRLQRWARRNRRPQVVRFAASAVAWTEVPEGTKALSRQRARWHQGLAESLWLNRALLYGERFGVHHGLAFLSQLLVELIGPLVELGGLAVTLGLIATGRVDAPFAVLYFATFVAGGTLVSLLGIALETVACPRYSSTSDIAQLSLYAFLENLGYRQLTAWWRLQGLWNALRRKKTWGTMTRKGHGETAGQREERPEAA